MRPEVREALSNSIAEAVGQSFSIADCKPTSGGCINDAWIVETAEPAKEVGRSRQKSRYFVKLNTPEGLSMFEAEAEALKEMASAQAIRVPEPVTWGIAEGQSYLVLEALSFGSSGPEGWTQMGRQLAQLHRKTAEQFGWHRDNTIGATPQYNRQTDDWATFFREQRLRPQFEMAHRKGFQFSSAESLLNKIDELLAGHSPAPSLLHGDLWSGNASFLEDGTPVIFDPATYYGDRETDLAFSEFFGGYAAAFYKAYEEEWPLEPGYEQRKILYNLYHVLNHANLFGGGYAGQAERMIGQLL